MIDICHNGTAITAALSSQDRASVEKAISLKPEGYLSKSLSAESVKREIDRFFEKRERR